MRARVAVGAVVVVVATLVGGASLAGAHEHQICTPGAGDPVLSPEPFHGGDPSDGAILNNPNVSATQYSTWGMHPLHHLLHLGPSADDRAITVVRLPTGSCPA